MQTALLNLCLVLAETQNTKYQHSLKKMQFVANTQVRSPPWQFPQKQILSAAHRLICSSISSKTSTDLEQVVISIKNYNFKQCTMERRKEYRI